MIEIRTHFPGRKPVCERKRSCINSVVSTVFQDSSRVTQRRRHMCKEKGLGDHRRRSIYAKLRTRNGFPNRTFSKTVHTHIFLPFWTLREETINFKKPKHMLYILSHTKSSSPAHVTQCPLRLSSKNLPLATQNEHELSTRTSSLLCLI